MSAQPCPTHIILEPNPSGHRLFYVEILFRAAHAAGQPVILVTTRDAVRSAQYAVHLQEFVDPNVLSLVESGNEGRAIGRFHVRSQCLHRATRLSREYPNAHLVIPELGHFLMPWALRRDRRHLARNSTAFLASPALKPAAAIRYLIRRQYSVRQASAAIARGLILNRLRARVDRVRPGIRL